MTSTDSLHQHPFAFMGGRTHPHLPPPPSLSPQGCRSSVPVTYPHHGQHLNNSGVASQQENSRLVQRLQDGSTQQYMHYQQQSPLGLCRHPQASHPPLGYMDAMALHQSAYQGTPRAPPVPFGQPVQHAGIPARHAVHQHEPSQTPAFTDSVIPSCCDLWPGLTSQALQRNESFESVATQAAVAYDLSPDTSSISGKTSTKNSGMHFGHNSSPTIGGLMHPSDDVMLRHQGTSGFPGHPAPCPVEPATKKIDDGLSGAAITLQLLEQICAGIFKVDQSTAQHSAAAYRSAQVLSLSVPDPVCFYQQRLACPQYVEYHLAGKALLPPIEVVPSQSNQQMSTSLSNGSTATQVDVQAGGGGPRRQQGYANLEQPAKVNEKTKKRRRSEDNSSDTDCYCPSETLTTNLCCKRRMIGGTERMVMSYVLPLVEARERAPRMQAFVKLEDIALDHAPLMDIDECSQMWQ